MLKNLICVLYFNNFLIMKTKLLLTGLALMIVTFIASGQQTDNKVKQPNTPPARGVYVDENKDGVCDYFETRPNNVPPGRGMAYGRGYGRGNRAGYGPAYGAGRGYAYGGGYGKGYRRGGGFGGGQASGLGRGQGRGPGSQYFDENKNGVCDRYEKPTDTSK
ncbi:MAG: hypothetical protein A2X05_01285 [Bacteroidetes bacterium GWE2_41_25]|nr:MAG: hypothetical protein A2X03_00695 [Bacteroidetes bacterium GWA2_40_15]OFX87447.1 MAG: hypothetical protein A2X06_13480 [Bacteroidetes bacterium GWC2_40_22]OFY00900.1 MAG: hypothetical protein A2X05_01285 [Bacteroidetes bacterium GWE2_41_25]OFY60841.1 MAG: hypothetical protein A2X04_01790 [Bacteroidetes bacterium GWF2_41_9]HAM09558.1 hypothetical protein [Bacteroidales bacterium]